MIELTSCKREQPKSNQPKCERMAWGRTVAIVTPVLDPHAHTDGSCSVTDEADESKDCITPSAGLNVVQNDFFAYLKISKISNRT